MTKTEARKTNREWKLPRKEFEKRFLERFSDPRFDPLRDKLSELAEIAWKNYEDGRKAPVTEPAGESYADPTYELSVDWIRSRELVDRAQEEHDSGKTRILLILASDRSEFTCPGEISKTFRLGNRAKEIFEDENVEVDILDLSETTSEFGKTIHPCKGCVSTAMPLCHWPCSCYPNHSLGQVNDWMNEIYPKWVRAHGVMLITPVYWHQAPSALKLMIDRLVCADGGNSDPTTTQGKDTAKAKSLELVGWDYPKHLKGRVFSVITHGDAVGVNELKNALTEWLEEMDLISAGARANLARYVGYLSPYATSHEELDRDEALFTEVELAARQLVLSTEAERAGRLRVFEKDWDDPRPK